jgi:hypothetical protein
MLLVQFRKDLQKTLLLARIRPKLHGVRLKVNELSTCLRRPQRNGPIAWYAGKA